MRLHLVRHGHSKVDPTTPASTWPLDPAADAGIEELRGSGVLPTAASWHSSAEPKALATARRLSPDGNCVVVEGLHEAGRPVDWLGRDEFTAAVRRSFAHPDEAAREGWEPLTEVGVRVATAAGAVINESRQQDATDVVLVGHGTAWTLLVAALTGEAPDLDRWEQMTMPDHCSIDLDRSSVASVWGQWRDGRAEAT